MKNFFQTLSGDSDLASSLTKDLKETVYLDKMILQDDHSFTNCCISSDNPFKHDKYKLFTWKVKCFWGIRVAKKRTPEVWTHVKAKEWTDDLYKCANELLHVNYDVVDCWGCRHYLYMRRPPPAFERLVPLVGAVNEAVNDSK